MAVIGDCSAAELLPMPTRAELNLDWVDGVSVAPEVCATFTNRLLVNGSEGDEAIASPDVLAGMGWGIDDASAGAVSGTVGSKPAESSDPLSA